MRVIVFACVLLVIGVPALGAVAVTPFQSECLPEPPATEGALTVTVEGCVVHMKHDSVHTNCCLVYQPKVEIDGFDVTIIEVDTGPPRDCICWFDLGLTIEGLPPGVYTITVVPFPGTEKATFTIVVPSCEDFIIMAPEVWAYMGTRGVVVPVFATNVAPLQGFSFGVTFNLQHARMADINLRGTITERVGAEYVALAIDNGEFSQTPPTRGEGWATFAVVLDVEPPFEGQTIPAGNGQRIANLVYDLQLPPNPARSMRVPFVDGLGKPPVPVVYVVKGLDVRPAKRNGIIQLMWPPLFIRGDANDNGSMTIADPIYLLNYLFGHGPVPPCLDAADANDDGLLNLSDAIAILAYLFRQGVIPPPSPPGPPGYDPTPDDLDCARAEQGPRV